MIDGIHKDRKGEEVLKEEGKGGMIGDKSWWERHGEMHDIVKI